MSRSCLSYFWHWLLFRTILLRRVFDYFTADQDISRVLIITHFSRQHFIVPHFLLIRRPNCSPPPQRKYQKTAACYRLSRHYFKYSISLVLICYTLPMAHCIFALDIWWYFDDEAFIAHFAVLFRFAISSQQQSSQPACSCYTKCALPHAVNSMNATLWWRIEWYVDDDDFRRIYLIISLHFFDWIYISALYCSHYLFRCFRTAAYILYLFHCSYIK
jgi:hypothetical protein